MSFVRNYNQFIEVDDFLPECRLIIAEYLCTLCTGVYYNPTMDTCGHIFCRECIEKHVETIKKCPISGCELTKANLNPVPFIKQILDKQKVYCKNKKAGCEWTGTYQNLEKHLQEDCNNQLIKCTNKDCEEYLLKLDLNKHLQVCEYKESECPNSCGRTFTKIGLSYHIEQCPKVKINCTQNCDERLERTEMEKHLKMTCPNTIIECTFSVAGCEVKLARSSMSAHIKSAIEKHLNLLLDLVVKFDKKSDNTESDQNMNRKRLSKKGRVIEDVDEEMEESNIRDVSKSIAIEKEKSISPTQKGRPGRPPRQRHARNNMESLHDIEFENVLELADQGARSKKIGPNSEDDDEYNMEDESKLSSNKNEGINIILL